MGFFSNLKKNLEEEVEKNKDLKEALNKFKTKTKEEAPPSDANSKEDASPKAANEAFEAARENLKQVVDNDAASLTLSFHLQSTAKAGETLNAGSEAVKDLFSKVLGAKSKVAEELINSEFVKTAKQAQEEIAAKVGKTDAGKAAKEAAKVAAEAAQKVAKAAGNVSGAAADVMDNKHELGTKDKYFKDVNAAPAKEVPEEEWDTSTTTLQAVKVKETPWDRQKQRFRAMADRHPVLRGIWKFAEKVGDKSGQVAGNMGDRVFGETDEALTVSEIKERDPEFAMMGFLKEVREVIIPEVLEAYLKADQATLKVRCQDQAYQAMFASVQERKFQGYSFDPRVLAIRDVQLAGARVLDNGPTLVITFNAQQIHCIKDKNGVIVDGSDEDIRYARAETDDIIHKTRSVYYTWAFQLDQDAYDLNWKLVEMQTLGAMKMI